MQRNKVTLWSDMALRCLPACLIIIISWRFHVSHWVCVACRPHVPDWNAMLGFNEVDDKIQREECNGL